MNDIKPITIMSDIDMNIAIYPNPSATIPAISGPPIPPKDLLILSKPINSAFISAGETWLMKGYFDTIPHELEEAALIDGATRFQTFMKIIIPLARPILTVIFILTFIGDYSEYLLASIILTGTKRYTLAVGLNLFITSDYARHWGTFAAAAIIGSLPVLFLFFSLQKQIISGLTGGGVKG